MAAETDALQAALSNDTGQLAQQLDPLDTAQLLGLRAAVHVLLEATDTRLHRR